MFKILLIEDDVSVQFTFKKLLNFLGNEVYEACNGQEGLGRIRGNVRFDAIICDIDMPLMNGFCFFEKILEFYPQERLPPFIFISAYVDRSIIDKVIETKATCILKKPIEQEMLKAVLFSIGSRTP